MAEQKFTVALQYGEDSVGYLTYDENQKVATVVLPDTEWVDKVQQYLHTEQTINNATGLSTYEEVKLMPLESLNNLKLALTRLWEITDVQVGWTRPIE